MPFDKTRVHPVVADLLKVRAWVAEHGFIPELGGENGGCFLCAIGLSGTQLHPSQVWEPIEQILVDSYGSDYRFPFASTELIERGITSTPGALEIIDAAIARLV